MDDEDVSYITRTHTTPEVPQVMLFRSNITDCTGGFLIPFRVRKYGLFRVGAGGSLGGSQRSVRSAKNNPELQPQEPEIWQLYLLLFRN